MELSPIFFSQNNILELHKEIADGLGEGPLGRQAAYSVGFGRSLGVKLENGNEFRFTSTEMGIKVDEKANEAKVILKTDQMSWQNLVCESWSMMGLILQNRITVITGEFNHIAAWEAPLQALYNDRPIFSSDDIPSEEPYEFNYDSDKQIMARSLRVLGFILVKGVFNENEIEQMSKEVDSRRANASINDKRSWWATDTNGNEHCCRVTYLNDGSDQFSKLPNDKRLALLASLADEKLLPTPDHGDGISVVMKVPEVEQGLSDLPWHRDCGMGGHPLICPGLNIGIQLDEASRESGQLIFLPGSHRFAGGLDVAHMTNKAVPITANPGDVTVHYGHTLHVAPPPTQSGKCRRTVYVSFHKADYLSALPKGKGYNDVLFSHGDGRVRAPLERVPAS